MCFASDLAALMVVHLVSCSLWMLAICYAFDLKVQAMDVDSAWLKGLDLDGNLFSAICSIVVPSMIIFPTLLARHWSSKLGPIAE